MITGILVTGEGNSDMGGPTNSQPISTGESYNLGPMALIAIRLIQRLLPEWNEEYLDFNSPNTWVTLISGNELARQTKGIQKHRPSKKLQKGFVWHANRATQMALYAKENGHQLSIYFHDTDKFNYEHLHKAVKHGFDYVEGIQGVPMIPKPTSEAWLICGRKEDPYAHCTALETDLSGNDAASHQNAPKKVLGRLLGLENGREPTTELQYAEAERVDISKIDMPSYNRFKEDLTSAITAICGYGTARTL